MIAAWLAWTQAICFTIYAAHMLKISVLSGPKGWTQSVQHIIFIATLIHVSNDVLTTVLLIKRNGRQEQDGDQMQ